jgi:hypothetical protein
VAGPGDFWLIEVLLMSNCGCCIELLTLHSQAFEPVLLLAAATRLWPSMDVLVCLACEAVGAFSRLGKLFVLAAGAMFVTSEDARCAFTSRCCCCPSRQRRREVNHFLRLAHRKDFLHKQGVFRKEGETLS